MKPAGKGAARAAYGAYAAVLCFLRRPATALRPPSVLPRPSIASWRAFRGRGGGRRRVRGWGSGRVRGRVRGSVRVEVRVGIS